MSAPSTDNENVTEKYRTLISERRRVLREQVDAFIPAGAAFVWEIGAGHGHFLTAYAEAHPGTLCVGIDIVGERVERALRKRDWARRANLRFFHAEARLFLQAMPAGARFSEIYVLFPDPWPKLRHHKHRIMQPAFLACVADHAAPACRLYFRTDFAPYFEDTLKVVGTHPRWELAGDPWPFEFETVFQKRAPSFQSLVARLRP